jgi:hypothetical protein
MRQNKAQRSSGGLKSVISKPPFSFEKEKYRGCIKVAHF